MGATPRVGTRLLLATTNYPNFFNFFFFNLPLNSKKNNCRDGRVQDQTELPRGLRGLDQQADQHGILCLVCLSFHEFLLQPGRPSPPRIRCSLQEGVRGGASPRHEADGIPDQAWRKSCLPGRRQADHHGMGISTCTRWPETRATDPSATSSSPSTWASRWRASR